MEDKALYNILFLPAVILVGLFAIFYDIRFSKIKNKCIVIGLLYAVFIYLFSWILYRMTREYLVSNFVSEIASILLLNFDKWFINLIVSVLISYAIWHSGLWGAGDAKLFIVYAALIPIGKYSRIYFSNYFASFSLLLNIFIPATIFILLKSLFNFIKAFRLNILFHMLKSMKAKFAKINLSETLKIFSGFLFFFLFFNILRDEFVGFSFKIIPNQYTLMLISLLIFRPLTKFFREKNKFLALFLVLFIFFIGFKFISTGVEMYMLLLVATFKNSFFTILMFGAIQKIIAFFEENVAKKSMPFAPWMFLGALITWFF
jgi:Flp pilus assembly protein protease CpaA